MYLKRLDMQGFKSFADKISLDFGRGITCIVGPNGSGKSNLSDAIRWVLGEQSVKSLRGSRMEDVIFSGTQKRRPVGFAEVSLTLDNSQNLLPIEYEEVTITRRVYRSGESEYMINKGICRLRDIHELFMDTGLGRDGYSIIGQGRIEEILSAKSEDRRQVFEEAAGISKYKYRKAETLRKLASTEENLIRTKDIVSELESRVGPLAEQSKKAMAYLDIREELKRLELNLAVINIERLRLAASEAEEIYDNAKTQLEKEREALEHAREQEQIEHGKMREAEGEIEKLKELRHSTELIKTQGEGEISLLENSIKNLSENIERIKGEIQSLNEDICIIDKEKNDAEAKTAEIAKKRASITAEIDILVAKSEGVSEKTSDKNSLLNSKEEAAHAARTAAEQADHNVKTMEEQKEEISQRISDITSDIEKTKEELREDKKKSILILELLEKKKKERNRTKDEFDIQAKTATNFRGEADRLKDEYNKVNADLNGKNARSALLLDMEKSMEGYASAVKALVASGAPTGIKIYGVLSKLINVQENFVTAIETALSGALQNIVVEREEDAKAAIELLKRKRAGRATFLPVSSVRGKKTEYEGRLINMPGFMGLGCDLVSCDEKFEQIITSLLGKTAVFDNIDNAVDCARKFGYRFKIVTMSGEVLYAGGSIAGGSSFSTSRFLGRAREIETLKKECAALTKSVDTIDERIYKKTEELKGAMAHMESLREEFGLAESEIIRLQGELELVNQSILHKREQQERLDAELLKIRKRVQEADGTSLRQEEEIKAQTRRAEETSKEAANIKEEIRVLILEREQINAVILDRRMSVSSLNKDIDMLNLRKEEADRRKNTLNTSISEKQEQFLKIEQRIAEIKMNIENKRLMGDEALKRVEEFALQIEKVTAERGGADSEIFRLRKKIDEYSESIALYSAECARVESRRERLENELDTVITKLWDDYEITYTAACELKQDIGPVSAARKRVAQLKGNMRALGNINLDSIEEYKQVKERFEFLTGQMADLEKAKEELEKIIRDMTKIMTERFLDQFKIINQHFGRVFTELFGGGRAGVSLIDPSNILESGIEIQAQPPGKKLQSLSLLSGGEKALTAIALLLAILNVRPTPFCILDEIEAALDEDNISKFADYIKGMIEKTQFIIVTHRRGTMEAADLLYGVTMQEKGVSKLLSMRLDEAAGA